MTCPAMKTIRMHRVLLNCPRLSFSVSLSGSTSGFLMWEMYHRLAPLKDAKATFGAVSAVSGICKSANRQFFGIMPNSQFDCCLLSLFQRHSGRNSTKPKPQSWKNHALEAVLTCYVMQSKGLHRKAKSI